MLITIVLVRYVPAALWMIPGIWQVIFSLGVFSSCRFLPRPDARRGRVVPADGPGLYRAWRTAGRSPPGRWVFPMEPDSCWWRRFCSSARTRAQMKAKAGPAKGDLPMRGWIA